MMGWCNYIVVDDWKLKFEVSREVNEENLGEIEDWIDNLLDSYEELESTDLSFSTELPERTIVSLLDMSFKTQDALIYSMGYNIIDYMFMYWLKNRGIKYRFISEFELDKDPADKYKKVSRFVELLFFCTECNQYTSKSDEDKFKYCPKCGAKIKDVESD